MDSRWDLPRKRAATRVTTFSSSIKPHQYFPHHQSESDSDNGRPQQPINSYSMHSRLGHFRSTWALLREPKPIRVANNNGSEKPRVLQTLWLFKGGWNRSASIGRDLHPAQSVNERLRIGARRVPFGMEVITLTSAIFVLPLCDVLLRCFIIFRLFILSRRWIDFSHSRSRIIPYPSCCQSLSSCLDSSPQYQLSLSIIAHPSPQPHQLSGEMGIFDEDKLRRRARGPF